MKFGQGFIVLRNLEISWFQIKCNKINTITINLSCEPLTRARNGLHILKVWNVSLFNRKRIMKFGQGFIVLRNLVISWFQKKCDKINKITINLSYYFLTRARNGLNILKFLNFYLFYNK